MSRPSPPLALPSFLAEHQARVDTVLDRILPGGDEEPCLVHRAMRHTALAPSKRVRAVLAFLAAELCGNIIPSLPSLSLFSFLTVSGRVLSSDR